MVADPVIRYFDEQIEQVRALSEGGTTIGVPPAEILQVAVADGAEDPVDGLVVTVRWGDRVSRIEAQPDADGELSGVLDRSEELAAALETSPEALAAWANAMWWCARDAIFLAGLGQAEAVTRELTELAGNWPSPTD